MKQRRVSEPLYPYTEVFSRVEDLGPAVGESGAPDTTFDLVREQSGPLCLSPTRHERYVIFSVSGYRITPGSWGALSGAVRSEKTWSVLDSLNAWEEVARFHPSPTSEAKARKEATRLNIQDRTAA